MQGRRCGIFRGGIGKIRDGILRGLDGVVEIVLVSVEQRGLGLEALQVGQEILGVSGEEFHGCVHVFLLFHRDAHDFVAVVDAAGVGVEQIVDALALPAVGRVEMRQFVFYFQDAVVGELRE